MFVPIVNTSISASWLILAVIAIRFVFKKMPKAMLGVGKRYRRSQRAA